MFLDLVREVCGDEKANGEDYRYCCPFCDETSYKFYVAVEEPHIWHCFKCGSKGNPVKFVMSYYAITFREALDILKTYDYDLENLDVSKFNSQYNDTELTVGEQIFKAISDIQNKSIHVEQVKVHQTMPPLPTNTKFFINEVGNPESYPFLEYLFRRGTVNQDVTTHGMGYVTHGTVDLLNGEKLTLTNHVVFITYNRKGKPIYWNTRAIDPEAYIKTFNAPSRDDEYGKNNTIFNLNNAMYEDKIVINEGVFDALTVGVTGVATFGKQVTQGQIARLREALEFNPSLKLYIYLDRDAYLVGERLAHKLLELTKEVYLVISPYEEDANSLGKETVQELLTHAKLATPATLIEYMMAYKK